MAITVCSNFNIRSNNYSHEPRQYSSYNYIVVATHFLKQYNSLLVMQRDVTFNSNEGIMRWKLLWPTVIKHTEQSITGEGETIN